MASIGIPLKPIHFPLRAFKSPPVFSVATPKNFSQ